MATVQQMVAAMPANQQNGPQERVPDTKKMNHHAAKGLQPTQWAGEEDPMAFQEFSAESTNFAKALNPGAKHVLDQAAKRKGVIDVSIDLNEFPVVEGLAEALDGEGTVSYTSPPRRRPGGSSTMPDQAMDFRRG